MEVLGWRMVLIEGEREREGKKKVADPFVCTALS